MVVELIVFDATEEGVGVDDVGNVVDDVGNVVVIVVRVDPGVGAIVVVVVIALSVNIVAKFSEVESDSVLFKEVFSPAELLANDCSSSKFLWIRKIFSLPLSITS